MIALVGGGELLIRHKSAWGALLHKLHKCALGSF